MNPNQPGYPQGQGGFPVGGVQPGGAPQGYPAGAVPQQYGYPAGAVQQQQGYPGGGPPPGYAGGPVPQQGYQAAAAPQPGYQYSGAGPPQQGFVGGGPPPQQGYPGGASPAQQGGAPQAPQYQGEMPADDVDDDENAVAPMATAPPMEKMDQIGGYTAIGGGALPPPTYDEAMSGPPPDRELNANVPVITEQDARDALLEYVAQHCCFGKGAAKNMNFTELKSTSAFHYTLETYTEGRSTAWAFVGFRGQPIDGPQNGPAPGPWDIASSPAQLFQNQVQQVEVPHTASVKPCHQCFASGFIRCYRCHGRGRVRCTHCHGSGHRTVHRGGETKRVSCSWCVGGRRTCGTCHGRGMIICTTCEGCCNVKCYICLTITWSNRVVDHIVERTPLPNHLIRGVSGQLAFQETQPRVWPINHFPEAEINAASTNLVQQQIFPTERILQQRHTVRIVPVTQCIYKWKSKDDSFFVYGFEKKVHAPDYPQQCCCGCSIL